MDRIVGPRAPQLSLSAPIFTFRNTGTMQALGHPGGTCSHQVSKRHSGGPQGFQREIAAVPVFAGNVR